MPQCLIEPLAFAVWTQADQDAGKIVKLDSEGNKYSEPRGWARGAVRIVRVHSAAELKATLEALTPRCQLTAGLPCAEGPYGIGGAAIARNKGKVSWPAGPGLLCIDCDKGVEPALLWERLIAAGKRCGLDLDGALHCYYPSSGSHFERVSDGHSFGVTGWHFLIGIDDGRRVEAVLEALYAALWLDGWGWINPTKSGVPRAYTYVDDALRRGNGCQLIYAGPPRFDETELRRVGVEVVAREGVLLRTHGLIKPDAGAVIAAAKGESAPACKAVADRYYAGLPAAERRRLEHSQRTATLPGDMVLYRHAGGSVTVDAIYDNPAAYDGEYFADPFEVEAGTQRARFFASDNRLYSFLHGGCQYLLEPSEAAYNAFLIWIHGAEPADPSHPILKATGAEPLGLFQEGGHLVFPLQKRLGGITGLLAIDAEAAVRRKGEGYALLGAPASDIYITSSIRAGLVLRYQYRAPCVAVGPLKATLEHLRARFPGATPIVAEGGPEARRLRTKRCAPSRGIDWFTFWSTK